MSRRIYVASSWRNAAQPLVVTKLRAAGHQVYDFRNPTIGYDNPNGLVHGFQWSSIDPRWESWTTDAYREALTHPLSEQGFASDWGAMEWADTGVLVLPSGRSAHLEAGYFSGSGKALYILMEERQEPELMYRMASGICLSLRELISALSEFEGRDGLAVRDYERQRQQSDPVREALVTALRALSGGGPDGECWCGRLPHVPECQQARAALALAEGQRS